ncbi:MAG: hypothetical protein ACLVK0_13355 [Parabacteroides merdae]
MEYKDKKYILKKLMQDALTEEERIALQSSRRVTKEMERQWNNAPGCSGKRSSGRAVYLAEYL